MSAIRFIARSSCLISLIILLTGCVVVPRGGHDHDEAYRQGYHEGYYDRGHHRYWHDNGWHDCDEDEDYCH